MSSWGSSQVRQRIRLGFHQDTPAGTFVSKPLPATVVSAYYEMPSKYTPDKYRLWLRYFLETIDCHLVFFTDETMKEYVEECRGPFMEKTKLIVLPRSDWVSNTKFSEQFWRQQHSLDPEKNIHSTELYKVWYEKKEFVRRAIALNPWNHTDFLWIDAGSFRSPEFARLCRSFPYADRIPTNKIMLNNVGEFTLQDENWAVIGGERFQGNTDGRMRIGGGCIAASKEMMLKYIQHYDTVFDKYIRAGLFAGKDQIIMNTVALEYRGDISLVEPKPIGQEFWFYLHLYLGAAPEIYARMRDKIQQKKKTTYLELLGEHEGVSQPRGPVVARRL
jgi:hypothetical protein